MRYWLLAATLAVTACSRDAGNPAKVAISVDPRSATTKQAPSAETDARVKRLQAMKAQAKPKPFDVCDDISSGRAASRCAAVRSAKADVARAARITPVVKSWSATDRALLASLTKAEGAFLKAHSGNWYAFGGTSASARSFGVEDEIRDFDADLLIELASGRVPAASPATVADSDLALNRAFKAIFASDNVHTEDGGIVGQISIRELRGAQRAWLRYRDAWLALASRKWPASVNGVAWALNVERARQLRLLENE